MYCHICGTELSKQAKTCPECGAPTPEIRESRTRETVESSNPVPRTIIKKVEPPQPSPDDYPMKWYYYLRYAHLFMVAAASVISGIVSMGNNGEFLWGFYQIAVGIFALVVRKALANFEESAPPLLGAFYALQYGGNAAYDFYQYLNSYDEVLWMSMFVIDIIIFVIMFGTHRTYFANRKALFTN